VRIADLAEAEGRALKRNTAALGVALALILLAALVAFAGIGAVLAGLWLLLEDGVGPAWASIIIGAAALALAGALLLAASKRVTPGGQGGRA
jgi:hypothetical protein